MITVKDKLWHFGIALVLQYIGFILPVPFYMTLFIVGLALGYKFCQWETEINKNTLNKWFVIDSILDLLAAVLGFSSIYGALMIIGKMV